MNGFKLILTLAEDCVFSDRAATVGWHRGLDYIPGAALLGAAAAKLYSHLTPAEAFTLFHSGQVRFSNGLPLALNNEYTWPIPLCWHSSKDEKFEQDKQLPSCKATWLMHEKIWRLGQGVELPNIQEPKQLRSGYVSKTGQVIKPTATMRMKTAIDPTTGVARESALFGYEAINAEQRFYAHITAETTVAKELLDKLRAALSGQILLGRSRSAEYGRVTVSVENLPPQRNNTDTVNSKQIRLWLLSDLAAFDDLGQPTLTLRPEWLGLPKGTMVLEETFLRTRRYSPWNSHRLGPDLERQVISQGSVLAFDLERPLNLREQTRISAGLGAHQEHGLGQVWLNPDWLGNTGGHPSFTPAPISAPLPVHLLIPTSRPIQTPLTIWLQAGNTNQATRGKHAKDARELAKTYQGMLDSARHLKGLDDKIAIGPSISQWGGVLGAAKTLPTNAALKSTLFDGDSCICKASMPGWKDEYWSEATKSLYSFKTWFEQVALKSNHERRFIQMLAIEIMDVLKGSKLSIKNQKDDEHNTQDFIEHTVDLKDWV